MLTAGILASAVAGLGAAAFFAGGEQQAPGPKVTPAVDTFLVQHAIVTGNLPVTSASGTPGGTASAAPVTPASRVPVGVAASGVTGAAAAAAARVARRSASGQAGSGRAASGQAASGGAAGTVRYGLRQPVPGITTPVPAATASVTVSASPGP
jgi:hypothetical protein